MVKREKGNIRRIGSRPQLASGFKYQEAQDSKGRLFYVFRENYWKKKNHSRCLMRMVVILGLDMLLKWMVNPLRVWSYVRFHAVIHGRNLRAGNIGHGTFLQFFYNIERDDSYEHDKINGSLQRSMREIMWAPPIKTKKWRHRMRLSSTAINGKCHRQPRVLEPRLCYCDSHGIGGLLRESLLSRPTPMHR